MGYYAPQSGLGDQTAEGAATLGLDVDPTTLLWGIGALMLAMFLLGGSPKVQTKRRRIGSRLRAMGEKLEA